LGELVVFRKEGKAMKDLPLVSIVTPSFNQGQFLERTIKSVLSQDYPNIEYIVIDGGSTDNSVEIIKKYQERISFWVSEKDKGQSDAINKGWRRANGVYCSYLNSDDALVPGAVSKIVRAFLDNPNVGVVYGDYTFIDETDSVLEECTGEQTDFKQLLIHGQIRYIAQPSFYISELVRRIGFIDETFHMAMDYDLLVKLAKESKMLHIPEKISFFRLHSNTKSATLAKRHWHETLRVNNKYNKLYMINPLVRYLQFRAFHLLPEALKLYLRKKRKSVHDQIILNNKK
jgi:glycosyltransferase involved in cell wall biosynthesis